MMLPIRIPALLIFTTIFSIAIVELAVSAPKLKGIVVAVDGFDVTIAVDPIELNLPVVGNKVDLIKTVAEGRVELDIGDWEVTEVNGRLVKAKAINALGVNPPKVNMKAVIHLSADPVVASQPLPPLQEKLPTYDSAFPATGKSPFSQQENKPLPRLRGKVIMTRGAIITIQMEGKNLPAARGNIIELSYSVADEVITVGTWRVIAIKGDGTVEAEPLEIKGEPNIGMDAVLFTPPGRAQVVGEKEPSAGDQGSTIRLQPIQAGQVKTPIEKEAKTRSLEETLASFSKTPLPFSHSGIGDSVSCSSGKIRIGRERIEMTASGGVDYDFCTLRMSPEVLDNLYVTAKVSLSNDSHNDFMIGFLYGDQSGDAIKPDSILVTLSQMSSKVHTSILTSRTTLLAWVGAFRRSNRGKSHDKIVDKFLPKTQSNPTPGTLAFVKAGQKCWISWNGQEMGSWEEPVMSKAFLELAFTPVVKGKATAIFEDIRIYRLHSSRPK